jgi:hypothetical protein
MAETNTSSVPKNPTTSDLSERMTKIELTIQEWLEDSERIWDFCKDFHDFTKDEACEFLKFAVQNPNSYFNQHKKDIFLSSLFTDRLLWKVTLALPEVPEDLKPAYRVFKDELLEVDKEFSKKFHEEAKEILEKISKNPTASLNEQQTTDINSKLEEGMDFSN